MNDFKIFRSKNYSYDFRTADGMFRRWGLTAEDDPFMSPFGPEIADIEVSTECSGPLGTPCRCCYKSNGSNGDNMSANVFEKILKALPRTVTQVALGIGDLDANRELFEMMEICRANEIVPNVTINGSRLNDERARAIADLCGAVAVSAHDHETCFNAVEKLTRAGMNQVNIHALVADETLESCENILQAVRRDGRLAGVNAVVFLSLKRIGRGRSLTETSENRFGDLVRLGLDSGVKIGFDSCSAPAFMRAVTGHRLEPRFERLAEPCESYLFSIYVDVNGKARPCSFCPDDSSGIGVHECDDFLNEIWLSDSAVEWREKLKRSNRKCPLGSVYGGNR